MNCTRTDQGTEVWLRIEGALDALTAPDLRPIFYSLIASRRTRVTLDLAPLTMIDSSGIGAIVSLYKRVKADGGQVVLYAPHVTEVSRTHGAAIRAVGCK